MKSQTVVVWLTSKEALKTSTMLLCKVGPIKFLKTIMENKVYSVQCFGISKNKVKIEV